MGDKKYKLTNHLGNVMAVVSDKVIDTDPNADGISDKKPCLYAAYDYYPFGMLMPNRYLSNNVTQCRPVSITSYNTTWVDMLLLDLSNTLSISKFDVASATH